MKVRDKAGERAGEAIGFRITRSGCVVFSVAWYGYPGLQEVAAADVEASE